MRDAKDGENCRVPHHVGRPMFLLSNLSLDIGRNSLSYGELGMHHPYGSD
jgi:hypothetical protein